MVSSCQPHVEDHVVEGGALRSTTDPSPLLQGIPTSTELTEVPLMALGDLKSYVNPDNFDTQTDSSSTSRPPDCKISTPDCQLLDTQREIPMLPEAGLFTSFSTISDASLPDTQCASIKRKLSLDGPGKLSTEAKSFMLTIIDNLEASKKAFPSEFQLPDTQTEADPSRNPLGTCVQFDSRFPDTDNATQEIATIQNIYPREPSGLSFPLPNTPRDTRGASAWINEELSCLTAQLSATQSPNSNLSPSIEAIIAVNDDPGVSDQETPIKTPTTPPFLAFSLPTLGPESSSSSTSEYLDTQKPNTKDYHQPLSFVSTSSTQKKPPTNKLSVRERKRIVCASGGCSALNTAMRLWIRNTHRLLDPFREDDDCWHHPSPPRGHVSVAGILRSHGKLQKTFIWQDGNGRHSLVLNYGIVSKLVYQTMNKQQLDGFINKQWHLSHLCGNWICVNPKHTTVEPGNVNISRNTCFSHRCGCPHNPPCMKDKKIALSADGKPVDHNASVATYEVVADDGDNWSVRSLDDEESCNIDEGEESAL